MNVNTKNLISITEANQNFSRVARLVDESGSVVILSISKRLIEKNRQAYEELAK
jgi:antitoxin Phd